MQIQNIQNPNTIAQTEEAKGVSLTARGKDTDAFSALLAALMGNMENMEAAEVIEVLENIQGEDEEAEMDLAYQMAIPYKLMNFQNQNNESTVEANPAKPDLVEEVPRQIQADTEILNLAEEGQVTTNLIPKEELIPKDQAKISSEQNLQVEGDKLEGEKIEKTPLEVKPQLEEQAGKMELPKTEISKEDKPQDFKTELINIQPQTQGETKEVQITEPKIEVKENIQRLNDSIIKLIETTTVDNKSVMKVKLYPEELGTLDLTLEMQEGKLLAKILVDNESIRQLFSDKLGDLSQNLAKQNINIQDFKVEVKPEASLDFNFQGEFSQENRKNPRTNRIYGHKEIMPEEIPVEVTSRLATSGELSILA